MKIPKTVLDAVIQWLAVAALLYSSWLLARWLDPAETENFFSAGGIIVSFECLVGLLVLSLTIAWALRIMINKIRRTFGG